jgi:hypothetical protein
MDRLKRICICVVLGAIIMLLVQRWVRSEDTDDNEFKFDIHLGDFTYEIEVLKVPVCGYTINTLTFKDGCVLRFCIEDSTGRPFGWVWLERTNHTGDGVIM